MKLPYEVIKTDKGLTFKGVNVDYKCTGNVFIIKDDVLINDAAPLCVSVTRSKLWRFKYFIDKLYYKHFKKIDQDWVTKFNKDLGIGLDK